MSYRLPKLKIICGMTNIITAVMLNVFSMPRTMFYVVIKKRVFKGRLCRPITCGNDDIMAYQWKKLYAMCAVIMVCSACHEEQYLLSKNQVWACTQAQEMLGRSLSRVKSEK